MDRIIVCSASQDTQAYRMSSIWSGMDRENVKQISNALHHVLLQPRGSQADPFFLLAHSVPFPTDSNGYPLFKNHYLNLFFSKTSSFFNSIRRFRSPNENPRAATLAQRLRLTSEDLYVIDMIRSERRRKPPVFGRPPTWTFIIPNLMLLLLFYYKVYLPG